MRGVLNLNKPSGISSYEAIRQLQRLCQPRPKHIGHAGTLDPIASGVLLILFEEATKISPFLQNQAKEYEAEILFGIQTDTDDITGRTIAEAPPPGIDAHELQAVLREFTGTIEQVPPYYSALKHHGQPLYKLARRGAQITPNPRTVTIYQLELIDWTPPRCILRCLVSAGTYIRSLGRDLGKRLNSCATLSRLVRTKSGRFTIADAVALEEIQTGDLPRLLTPIPEALADMPKVTVTRESAIRLLQGKRLSRSTTGDWPSADGAALAETADKRFLAVVEVSATTIRTKRIIYADW